MCGIVAVLRRDGGGDPPAESWVLEQMASACATVNAELDLSSAPRALERASDTLGVLQSALRSLGGLRLLIDNDALVDKLAGSCADIDAEIGRLEDDLDRQPMALDAAAVEILNASLTRARDAVWAVSHDRLSAAPAVRDLGGQRVDGSALRVLSSLEMVMAALDRLEVRGRDSAGVHVLLANPGAGAEAPALVEAIERRCKDPLFRSGSVRRTASGVLGFVYKAAAEIGELGDNGAELRAAIREDGVLQAALSGATAVVLGHTRWASVGLTSEANAHPLDNEESDERRAPYVVAALNGDVDNYVDLLEAEGLQIAPEITTDAKVIPALMSRRQREGLDVVEAFRRTVASFSGSVAIAAQSETDPDLVLLALHGSGQGLYIGLMEDGFIVASEPYGLVEQTATYLRMDGDTESPSRSRGQIIVLDGSRAGRLEGIRRLAYDGSPLPVEADELQSAAITTRDIDRGAYPHYLLKEISQAPSSFHKTLRGRLVVRDDSAEVRLGEQSLPRRLVERLSSGAIDRLLIIGQGTAAVAGEAVAELMARLLPRDSIEVAAMPATELSGFRLCEDMSDSLVIAISQSGTTNDTNRTVDLSRARGAAVISIVNRRGSDLTDRSDGVLYTSDGRDVEMSVASTKAFYAQIAAGFLLGFALRQVVVGGPLSRADRNVLTGLATIPAAMESVLEQRASIARLAQTHAPSRRHWAVVGNGGNRVAAEEIRIKLSELCYKSIACDATEDKKHIDLSCEPLILVCAAGLSGSTLDDVRKEVEIYKAHRALPIVIASEGDAAVMAGTEVIEVPAVEPSLAFILVTVVGHLFGYEAALAIDRLARPLREIRSQIEDLVSAPRPVEDLLESLRPRVELACRGFFDELACQSYDGQLEASTAVRISSLLRYVQGLSPLESYYGEHGGIGSPTVVIESLAEALTRGIDELTRPIDAIKHQAKTVTVGISRADEALLSVSLVRAVVDAGVASDHIGYRDLRSLAGLDPAVSEVCGYTHYRILDSPGGAGLEVVGRGGISKTISSRTADNPELRGTKHLVATERQLLAARGASDGRTFILVPEIDGDDVVGLLLLHVRFREQVTVAAMRGVLASYRNRYVALEDAVMETEPEFREELLSLLPVADLLTQPIHDLARQWRAQQLQPDGVLK